jgi:hypothetical protein
MLKGYRTYLVAALIAMIGFLAELSPEQWTKLVDDPAGGLSLIGSGIIMAIMRKITTTPPGKAADETKGDGSQPE